MKKSKIVSLLVCFMLLLQCFLLSGCGQAAPVEVQEATADTARSLLLYDMEKDAEVCSYNPDGQVAPGSLARLVTALIAVENCQREDVVTVSQTALNGLPAGGMNENLQPGEQLTVGDLAACVILKNAGDAALVLAEHIAGSQQDFAALMNERVKDMGCTDTVFADAYGLDSEHSHTTARDMARIVKEAVKNETFRELFGAENYEVPATGCSEARDLFSMNYMLSQQVIPDFYDSRVTGGVQSYSSDAGASLVCTVEDGGSYIAVVLGAERVFHENGWQVISYGNYEEMASLLEQGLSR